MFQAYAFEALIGILGYEKSSLTKLEKVFCKTVFGLFAFEKLIGCSLPSIRMRSSIGCKHTQLKHVNKLFC